MSISVGNRVQSMIDHMSKNEIELALSDICIAIDITSQKYYNESKSSASCYKRFLKENMWMIIVTGMGSIVSETIKLPFTHKDIKSDAEGYCTLEQVIYHVMCFTNNCITYRNWKKISFNFESWVNFYYHR